MDRLWEIPAEVVTWIAILSVISFFAGVIVVPWLLVRIPHDYFLTHNEYLPHWKSERPVLRGTVLAVRNIFGGLLVFLGIVMLVAPGQGVVTVLLGLSLTTFPGKRRLELALLRRKGVLRAINWMRSRSDRDPLMLPDQQSDSGESSARE